MLSAIANSQYAHFVSELFVYVPPPVGPLERIRYREELLDQDCIVNSGLDLLWLTLAFQQFSKLRIVRITDELPGASPHAYPLAYRSLLAPQIATLARPSEESVSHAVLVVLTAASEAKLTLDTFDILLSCSAPMWEDDFDLESLHSDSTEVNVGSCGGLDLSGMGLSSAYFKHIQPFMAHLKCLRLRASFYPGHNPSEQLAHLITLAATLKRLDLWFDAPAASLFRSLAAGKALPELAELTLAGLVTDLASAENFLQRLSPSLTELTLCHIMLEETTLSKDGWVTLLGLVAKSLSLHSLTFTRSASGCSMTGSRCATAVVRRLRRGSTRTSYPKCNFTPVNCGSAWIVRCCSPNTLDDASALRCQGRLG